MRLQDRPIQTPKTAQTVSQSRRRRYRTVAPSARRTAAGWRGRRLPTFARGRWRRRTSRRARRGVAVRGRRRGSLSAIAFSALLRILMRTLLLPLVEPAGVALLSGRRVLLLSLPLLLLHPCVVHLRVVLQPAVCRVGIFAALAALAALLCVVLRPLSGVIWLLTLSARTHGIVAARRACTASVSAPVSTVAALVMAISLVPVVAATAALPVVLVIAAVRVPLGPSFEAVVLLAHVGEEVFAE